MDCSIVIRQGPPNAILSSLYNSRPIAFFKSRKPKKMFGSSFLLFFRRHAAGTQSSGCFNRRCPPHAIRIVSTRGLPMRFPWAVRFRRFSRRAIRSSHGPISAPDPGSHPRSPHSSDHPIPASRTRKATFFHLNSMHGTKNLPKLSPFRLTFSILGLY